MQREKIVQKSDLTTVVLHWAFVITMLFSLSTGLRISADAEDSVWARALSPILLQGDVMRWHVWAAFSLFLIAVVYVIFLGRARLRSRVAVDRARLVSVGNPDRATRWSAINVFVYWLAFGLIFTATATGIPLYLFAGGLPHATVIAIHRAVAWLFILYTVLHIGTQFILGGVRQLLKIVNPRAAYGAAAVTALTVAAVSGAGVYVIDRSTFEDLKVAYTSAPPTIDGDPSDAAWMVAPPVEIHTERGVNQAGGEVTVSVRALHDGQNVYALFEWPDPTRSQKHLPLVKTENGWKVLQHEFDIQDEDYYYEDKFGVMFARTPSFAGGGSAHLGPKPLRGKPGPAGGRGLHYTVDGSIVDVWHWKSVRTGSVSQIDDNYFGPPMEPDPKKKRYTGGYTQDPGTGGGYKMNWEKFSTDTIRPKRLPKDPTVLERLGDVDLDPGVSDTGEFWMPVSLTIPYSKERDTYPVGTVMPSVLIEGPREGDRGDVTGVARWKDGWWRLEASRKLDTRSEYDIALVKGQPTYLWVAVFDHAQTRHSLHLHPVRVVLE